MTYNNKLAWTLVKQLFGKTGVVSILLYKQFLRKVCGKFEFLSNNCSAKQVYFSILLYRQYASKSLWKVLILVKQLFGKTGVFLHPIIQASKSLWKVWFFNIQLYVKKGIFFHPIAQALRTFFEKIVWMRILSDISQAISLQKFIQIADIFSLFCYINACYQNVKKKSQKAWKFPVNCLYNRQTFYWHIPSEQKCLCRPIADSKQTIGLSGDFLKLSYKKWALSGPTFFFEPLNFQKN
jgi:hypothetical protein